MSNIIKIKNKVSAGVPLSSQMVAKEFVMHEIDDSLYYKRETDNVVIKVNQSSGGSGLAYQDVMRLNAIL